ncbi:MAG: 30S ribosomal protein S12 methylthiotransferase RimO, partial [Gemmatimonadota bacterium]
MSDRPGTRLGLVSLGCDKNTVDSERLLAALLGHGAHRVDDLLDAEVILVNTCGFIDAAKEESIETLLEAARLKEEGRCRAVVAVGCMVERHREEMEASLPEVDLFLGLRDLERLIPELRARGLLGTGAEADEADRAEAGSRIHRGERVLLRRARHVRYLKVSEGCDHGCAFCAIPLWRGRHRSFDAGRLVAEAQRLEAQGTVEVNLVAQDLAHYGRDRRDGTDIAVLLRRLIEETSIPWFRLLYIYSAGLREPLVEMMASEPRLLPYVDMPIQHASDPVLERMRRPERAEPLRDKIARLRVSVPDLTLRTTVLVGFPGETERDFRALLDFVEDVRFDRLGAFEFSPQEGTRAAALSGDLRVPADVARERLEELLEVQRAISAE